MSQRDAINYLDEEGIRFDSSFAGNDVYVWCGDDQALRTLANLPEVLKISTPRKITNVTLEVCNPAGCDDKLKSFEVLNLPLADLSVKKIDLIDPITSGETLYYQITAANYGQNDAVNVLFTDTPDYEFTLITSSYGCSAGDENVTCSYPELASGNETVIILGFALTT